MTFPLQSSRPVIGGGSDDRLNEPTTYSHSHTRAGDRLHSPDPLRLPLGVDSNAVEAGCNSPDIVIIVGSKFHFDQPTCRCANDAQLPTAVASCEPSVRVGRKAKVGVVRACLGDVGYRDRDCGEAV